MTFNFLFLNFLIFQTWKSGLSTYDCGPLSACKCDSSDDSPLMMDCSDAGFTVVHLKNMSSNVTWLDLSGNDFEFFNLSDFASMKNLTQLFIKRSHVKQIDGSLANAPPLNHLDLSDNSISDLQHGQFVTHTLYSLVLSNNMISSISQDALKALLISPSLRALDLSRNKISSFPAIDSHEPSGLLLLNLSGNGLGEYLDDIHQSENFFYRLKNVQTMDLSSNEITELHHYLLADMTKMINLNLSNNLIEDIGQISLSSDYHKHVTFNHFGQDSPPLYWFPHGLFALQSIDLSRNKIKIPDMTVFSVENLPSLKKLDLSFNEFNCSTETYMFFEAFLANQLKSVHCHKNKSEICITFPRHSLPKDFQIVNVNDRTNTSGYFCKSPAAVEGLHVLDFPCFGRCRSEYISLLPKYQNWKQEEEIRIAAPDEVTGGFTLAISLAVLTVIILTSLVLCYKLDIWRRLTGQMRYVQVQRNLLQLEGGDDAVI